MKLTTNVIFPSTEPYRLAWVQTGLLATYVWIPSWATPMPFSSINSTNPRTNPLKFSWKHEKILRIGGAGKWGFLSWPFWFSFFKKRRILLHLNRNKQPVDMRYQLFLHYVWFLQNLGKDFIPTNMHTTVDVLLMYDIIHSSAHSSISCCLTVVIYV